MSKVVVVTGAAGALGSAVVKYLAGEGWETVGVDHSPTGGPDEAALMMGGVDLTDEAATRAAFADLAKTHSALAGLVNIAGGFRYERVDEGSADTWDLMYRMNVKTALNASRAALPLLKAGRGAIVNVGAAGAVRADAGMGAYAASKAGVMRLTEAMAAELKDEFVRVNAVLPSIIDTPANRAAMPEADVSRWVKPDSLAATIAFLVSDKAEAITGALLPVTGRV